jgi:hypothetical protein
LRYRLISVFFSVAGRTEEMRCGSRSGQAEGSQNNSFDNDDDDDNVVVCVLVVLVLNVWQFV